MTQIPSLAGTTTSRASGGDFNAFADLDLGVFLKLLITELQNQDPMNPLDNSEMLAQINQIREVGATDKLTQTLESVLLGQNIASATNLIGAEVDAISDTNEKVSGRVSRVSISNGQPQLELDLQTTGAPQLDEGGIEPGTYSYRVVWQGERGLEGIELSDDLAISTESDTGNRYRSIRLENLPITDVPKQVYRTDSTGTGDYRLVATLTNGTQSTYLDTTGDGARSETRQTDVFRQDPKYRIRNYKINLNNVSSIRPPGE